MTAQKKMTCADIVEYAMENRLNDLKELWEVYIGRKEPTDEISEESYLEYGLSFDYVDAGTDSTDDNYFRYQISYGGPSEEFRFFCYKDHQGNWMLSEIEFWYMDWFDGASATVTGDHYKFMKEVFHDFDDLGMLDSLVKEEVYYGA